jgi:DNA-directed RNA polymerase, mitochondrial
VKDLRLNQYEPTREKARAIAKAIEKAIGDIATSTKDVRGFLEEIAAAYAAANRVMRWTTPLGLPVLNAYHKMQIERIEYPVNGKRKRVKWCTGNLPDVRPGKAKSAITANFVHSADAALLHAVALAAKAEGIEIVTVHDCFGCLAPHARRLNEILREQLIKIHEHDWLKAVHDTARQDLPNATLPDIPQRGNLDPNLVRHSFFAFN